MITYQANLQNIEPNNLEGFFVGWPKSPNPEQLWQILNNSEFKIVAIEIPETENSQNQNEQEQTKFQKIDNILEKEKTKNKIQNKLKVVGFIAALSDEVLTVYISLLEVLPEFQKRGIGKNLVSKMLELTKDFYMIDLVCDENLVDFYDRFGMKKQIAMSKRNYKSQSGNY